MAETKNVKEVDESNETHQAAYQPNPTHLDGVPDMSSLIYLEEDNVIHNLRCRYKKTEIYTYIQSVMIAINPYDQIPIYNESVMNQYRGKKKVQLAALPPHCFAVAEESYQFLSRTKINQSMVICGESGSGKTESAKIFMRYLAHITGESKSDETSIEQRFLQANPILEAFGNAQTILNNNSSRFGKFTKVLFENHNSQDKNYRPRIIGSFVETYLLEKSRVVFQEKGERNYHIFYQTARGVPKEKLDQYKIDGQNLQQYTYLNQSEVYNIIGVSDEEKFKQTSEAMKLLNFSDELRDSIFRTVFAILHFGNIRFTSPDADSVLVDDKTKENMQMIAELLKVNLQNLERRLISRNIKVGVQVIVKALSRDDAVYNRDAIAKILYNQLFLAIVVHINKQLVVDKTKGDPLWIGILDVFGFESSDFNNSFEQLCINYANERLQQYFNNHVVMSEQQEYLREALPWTPLKIADNQDLIDLIETKPKGIIATLDSTCVMPKGTDEIFVQNLFEANKKHTRIKEARTRIMPKKLRDPESAKKKNPREKFVGFTIEHYAGIVCYNATGFMDKNTDSVHEDTVALFTQSQDKFIASLLAEQEANAKKRAFKSVGSEFQKQLQSLMDTLHSTTPHFVRCVNPNQFKRPQMFDAEYVRPQLRCGGLMEALRILKLGFPSRTSYKQIYERFGHLLPKSKSVSDNQALVQRDFCEAIFMAFGASKIDYQFGLTKVFFRPGKQEFLEDIMNSGSKISEEMTNKIRSLMVRRRWQRARAAVYLLVRLFIWIKHLRSFREVAGFCRSVTMLNTASAPYLRRIKQNRATTDMQASIRTVACVREQRAKVQAVHTVQLFQQRVLRKRALHHAIEQRVEISRDKRKKAATIVQQFLLESLRRKNIKAELEKRVNATRARKEYQAKLDRERLEREEAERKRKLEEEKKKAEVEAAERKRKEEEERKRREVEQKAFEEKLRKEEVERKRLELEALETARKEDEKRERERLEAEKRKCEEEERKIKEQEERQKHEAEERSKRDFEAREKARKWQELLDRELREREKEEKEQLENERKKQEEAATAVAAAHKAKLEQVRKDREEKGLPVDDADQPRQNSISVVGKDGSSVLIPNHIIEAYPDAPQLVIAHLAERKQQEAEQYSIDMRQVLLSGGKFLKYGKLGSPHIRYICLNVLGHLHWDKTPMDYRQLFPSSSFIKLSSVLKIMRGKETATLKRKVAKDAPDFLCFSIVSSDRTLDLQAVNVQERDLWIRALESAIKEAQAGMVDFITGAYSSSSTTGTTNGTAAPPAKGYGSLRGAPAARVTRSVSMIPSSSVARSNGSISSSHASSRPSVTDLFGRPNPSVVSGAEPHDDSTFNGDTEVSVSEYDREIVAIDMSKGDHMLMFGLVGTPKVVFVQVLDNVFLWTSDEKDPNSKQSVKLSDIQSVRPGKVTKVLQQRSTNALTPPQTCFSIILKTRTLDFQCESEARRDSWVGTLNDNLRKLKQLAHLQYLNRKHQKAVMNSQGAGAPPPVLKRSQSMMLPKNVRLRSTSLSVGVLSSSEQDLNAPKQRGNILDSAVFQPPLSESITEE